MDQFCFWWCAVVLGGVLWAGRLWAVDVDGSGVSDVFEMQVGRVLDGGGDTDGDGVTDRTEFWFGRDPLAHDGGVPLVEGIFEPGGEVFRLVWERPEHMRFQVWVLEGRGVLEALGDEVVGAGTAYEVSVAGAGRGLFRVEALGPPDGDGDGLDAWEENELGLSDEASDTEGDGLGDLQAWLVMRSSLADGIDGNDLSSAEEVGAWDDFDGDGIPNVAEAEEGFDPADPDSDGDGWWDGFEQAPGGGGLDSENTEGVLVPAARTGLLLYRPSGVGIP